MSNFIRFKIKKARKLARRTKFQGMDISIETDKGQYRHWHDPHNNEDGKTKMIYPYGYIRRTDGADGEQVDVFVGPNEKSDTVYIIRQMKAPDFDMYDEDKVMVGFESPKDAKQAYLTHYNSDKFFGTMDEMPIDKFKNKYIKKAIPSVEGSPSQDSSIQDESSMQDPMMMGDPYDVSNPTSVSNLVNRIGTINDKELLRLVKEIWGENYEYRSVSENQIRAEVLGFLKDQMELIDSVHPAILQQPNQPLLNPEQLQNTSSSFLGPQVEERPLNDQTSQSGESDQVMPGNSEMQESSKKKKEEEPQSTQ